VAKLIVKFAVEDVNRWRSVFDQWDTARSVAGLTNVQVFRAEDRHNEVLVLSDVADPAKARAMLGSAELREAMQRAGVEGPPEIHIAE
jgi:hypothetical protein